MLSKRIGSLATKCGVLAALLLAAGIVHAQILGETGAAGNPVFNMTASTGNIDTPDGNSLQIWGYGIAGKTMQYPGPTLIVNEGDLVTINLTNVNLPMPTSMLFPGQTNVTATSAANNTGLLTVESTGPSDVVTYTFVAGKPGTYTYYSGTRPGLQIDMGLVGALIVRSSTPGQAYNDASGISAYDREYLFVLTEMDPAVHIKAEFGLLDQVDNTVSRPTLWFINGRNGPDTVFDNNIAWMPYQPLSSLARMHPGEKVLIRVVGGGRELHPFHLHGNNFNTFARDGVLLEGPNGEDLRVSDYTLQTHPGATYDAIWTWTGERLGWDIYGHAPGDPLEPSEYAADHGKPIPVTLPELSELTFGGFYSGSPFLGGAAALPPGEGGLNLNNGLFFMWHSHNERELTNDDVFPGGMMTMMIVEPPGVPIP